MKKNIISAAITTVLTAVSALSPVMNCFAAGNELPILSITSDSDILGDVNGDFFVDASDASEILADYAHFATSKTHIIAKRNLVYADADGSGFVDASDASYVLAYYSYKATGGTLSSEKYFALKF